MVYKTPVFISYRRDDSAAEAGRLADLLRPKLGKDSVFLDVSSIDSGEEWPDKISKALESSKTVLVVIGPDWLKSKNEFEQRRLDLEEDWVRKEIDLALQDEDKIVVPVLVKGAKIPPPEALPSRLKSLPKKQDIVIRRDHWDHDVKLLLSKFEGSEGLRALTELLKVPEMKEAVAHSHDDFAMAEERIELVNYLKHLHDLLHIIHMQCFNTLVNNAPGFPDEPDAVETLDDIHFELKGFVEELSATSSNAPQGPRDDVWIKNISQVASGLREAIDSSDANALQSKIGALNSVLNRIPGKINQRLSDAAYSLNVSHLVKKLKHLCDKLRSFDLEPARMAEFEGAVGHLSQLEKEWVDLVERHSSWEYVESSLRSIDTMLRLKPSSEMGMDDLSDLTADWDFLRQEAHDLLIKAGDSSAQLDDEVAALDMALDSSNLVGIRTHYRCFRRIAGRSFYIVDKSLKALCGEMVLVGQRLKPLTSVSP